MAPPTSRRPSTVFWLAVALTVGICAHTALFKWTPPYDVVTEAARNIVRGVNPYAPSPKLDFFKYSPLAGLLMLPFSIMPDALGTFLLLVLQAGLFFWGLVRWARAAGYPLKDSVARQWIAFFSVFLDTTLAIQVGQWNVGLFGLMLLGAAQYAEGRYIRSGLVLSLATNLKLFPFTLGLCLLTGLKKKYWSGFLGGLALWFLLPSLIVGLEANYRLLTQWYRLMTWDVTRGQDPMVDIATFLSLHFGVGEVIRIPLALLVGLVIGATTFVLFQKGDNSRLDRFLLPLNGLYVVLFSYLSESATSVLATGGIFLIGMKAIEEEGRRRLYSVLWVVALVLIPAFYSDLVTHDLSQWARGFHMKTMGYLYTSVVVLVLSWNYKNEDGPA